MSGIAGALLAFGGSLAGQTSVGPIGNLTNYIGNNIVPTELPDVATAFALWTKELVSYQRFTNLLNARGVPVPANRRSIYIYAGWDGQQAVVNPNYMNPTNGIWEDTLSGNVWLPTLDELLDLKQRRLIDDNLFNHLSRRITDGQGGMISAFQAMKKLIPGPSDLVRFAVREAFSPDLITLFGYNKEFPTQILDYMAKQGFDGSTGMQIPAQGTTNDNQPRQGEATWTDLFWWSHWELPSLTQGYEMLHRLYNQSDYGPSPYLVNNADFNSQTLEQLQRAQDIPDYWRGRLQAISYHSLNPSDAEILRREGKIDDAEHYHALRNAGYDDRTAKIVMKRAQHILTVSDATSLYRHKAITPERAIEIIRNNGYSQQDAQLILQKEIKPLTATDATYAFENNIIGEGRLLESFLQQGYQRREADTLVENAKLKKKRSLGIDPGKVTKDWICSNYKIGTVSREKALELLTQQGFDEADAGTFIKNCELEMLSEQVATAVKHMRLAVLRGIMSLDEARTELTRVGINSFSILHHLENWRYERDLKVKQTSAQANIRYFVMGIIDENALTSRLFNLGYDGTSITIMVSAANAKVFEARDKALQKSILKTKKLQEAAAKKALADQKKTIQQQKKQQQIVTNKANKKLRDFVKVSSDANVKAWWDKGFLELWEVYYRLFYKGYTMADADRWVKTNMPDQPQEKYNGSAKKAQDQYRIETGQYVL